MVVLGIDDTDSRTHGQCTTWIGSEIARRLPSVKRTFLLRLNPAIEYKTRGNGCVAIHADCSLDTAVDTATEAIDEFAAVSDPETNPGLAGVSSIRSVSTQLREFARHAVRSVHTLDHATELLANEDIVTRQWGTGRGIIGAAAAVGAVPAFEERASVDPVFRDWTYERLAYREPTRWGSSRTVNCSGIDSAVERWHGDVWDTIDPDTGAPVCVPHSPCPVLYGIRGDDREGVAAVSSALGGEPVDRSQVFITNQGTDAHLHLGRVGNLRDDRSYRVAGRVATTPTTGRGGHVTVSIQCDGEQLDCLAFSPTGKFRDRVRALSPGDRVIVCGEVGEGSLKLEKFGVTSRVLTARTTPVCPACGARMESAGRNQGYRCRDCDRTAPRKAITPRERTLELGWYEVPPMARRHLAKPLVRGSYDLPVHPTS